MSELSKFRRAAGERYVPYTPTDGLNLQLRAPQPRRRVYGEEEGVPALPPMKDVVSHSKGANFDAAAALRGLMDDNTQTTGPTSTVPRFSTGSNTYASPASRRGGYGHRAFLARSRSHRSQGDASTGANGTFPHRWTHAAFPRTKQTQDTFHKSIRRFQKYDKHHRGLRTLQHVGGGDQTTEWRTQNHHLLMGQDCANFAQEEAACDLPMPRTVRPGIMASVRLDPDLPPLSAEHPTRVWNAILHALAPKLQPIVRWEYENVVLGVEEGYVAHVTILLPPTHPAIVEHPAASALPEDRYSREYAESVKVLGGVRSWVGQGRKRKTDAQNSTITLCLSENALGWVYDPQIMSIDGSLEKTTALAPVVDLGMDLVNGTTASIEFQQDHDLGVYGCRLTVGREPHFQTYMEDTVHPSAHAAEEAVCRRAVELNVRVFLAWLQETEVVEVQDRAIGTDDDGQIGIDEDELPICGVPMVSDNQTMSTSEGRSDSENSSSSTGTAVNGVNVGSAGLSNNGETEASEEDYSAGRGDGDVVEPNRQVPDANPEGISALLPSPSDTQQPATPRASDILIKQGGEETELFVPRPKSAEIDWQSQLAYFCHISALPPPTYSQRIVRRSRESTVFVGKVKIENETYESADAYDTIFVARQSIAREVFTETFRQQPAAVADMPPDFRP
ncbi:hypothetical protein CcaverHIS002_0402660 [Cutaneotrichosporon cavernicola]|uniref:Uncharacterized protein n=1 Tax=Cutaneotrichosporon cavernicola TaxID=279322 RepID=A0AA48QVR2_9TREE|nr:uncharacterized protein CcaverHIS019_0402620 [Cutaneotrichosporon cavernicola]BEI83662.1 hypothetical protein CcaverHIS002_0402660 [Cutaneotrichosporon cavernicola]BEI91442.1 hypothetical protein CcaverHIS019_0402620 [Cutaneotrichosporon cavernicola]BEI99216.1 hypothetical protein CcaverHIS631_0402590 [Cutaneotrichosporon cavernicola]BEJ06993.1 hypothetical protein CcaverHIS641_0402620 [Cutaneotrichosporon cavernicola]